MMGLRAIFVAAPGLFCNTNCTMLFW